MEPHVRSRIRKVVFWLTLGVIGMFFFCYALVPLYNVLCKSLGINGKTSGVKATDVSHMDMSRTIRMQFLATNNANLPWEFRPTVKQLEVHPGETATVSYFAKNNSGRDMTVQAIPSVSPGLAARHLKKTVCFCFEKQTLKAGVSRDMPIVFHFDNELPTDIHEVTVSYTLFEAK